MATRILLMRENGECIMCIDGHHGGSHAARCAFENKYRIEKQIGEKLMVVELTPAIGGDDFRIDVLQKAGRIRIDFHERPDGKKEIVSLCRFENKGGSKLASVGAGKGLTINESAATTASIRCHIKIIEAPETIHGKRDSVRIPIRERSQATTPANELRIMRKLEKVRARQ